MQRRRVIEDLEIAEICLTAFDLVLNAQAEATDRDLIGSKRVCASKKIFQPRSHSRTVVMCNDIVEFSPTERHNHQSVSIVTYGGPQE